MRQTTIRTKPEEVTRQWRLVDASGKSLGRLAAEVSQYLMGKHRPDYTPHIDTGDPVIIINAEKIMMTGRKAQQRLRTFYSGYAGGLRVETYEALLKRCPDRVVEDAIKRMLPKGILGRSMMDKLKVYKGADHPHAAQQPVPVEI